jgi:hypothetical protein
VSDGCEYFLVTRLVDGLWRQNLTHDGIGVLVDHQSTQHGTLHIGSLWLYVGIGIVDGLLPASALSSVIICLFGHDFYDFGLQRYKKKWVHTHSYPQNFGRFTIF